LARERIWAEPSITWRSSPTYAAMICIDCDTEITGNPVWRATRSAVR
jgi:hypothetical protein